MEKNKKKMEKLVLGKEGVAQIAPHGEQRFDANPNQPKAGEGKLGVETMLAGCASVAVKKAEVWEAIHKTLPEAQRTQGIASKLELSLQQNRMSLALVKNLVNM